MTGSQNSGVNAAGGESQEEKSFAKNLSIAMRFLFLNAEFFAAPFQQGKQFQQWAAQTTGMRELSDDLWNAFRDSPQQILTFAEAISGLIFDDADQLTLGIPARRTVHCMLHGDSELMLNIIRHNRYLPEVLKNIMDNSKLQNAIEKWYITEARKPTREREEIFSLRGQLRKINQVLNEGELTNSILVFSQFSLYLKSRFKDLNKEEIKDALVEYNNIFSLLKLPSLVNMKIIQDAARSKSMQASNEIDKPFKKDLLYAIKCYQRLMGTKRCRSKCRKLEEDDDLDFLLPWLKKIASAYILTQVAKDEGVYAPLFDEILSIIKKSQQLVTNKPTEKKTNDFDEENHVQIWASILANLGNELAREFLSSGDIDKKLIATNDLIFIMDQLFDMTDAHKKTLLVKQGIISCIEDFSKNHENSEINTQELITLQNKIYELDEHHVLKKNGMPDISAATHRSKNFR